MKVPFLDLKIQYAKIKDEIADVMQEVLDNTAFAGGFVVERFEKEFAAFCKCDHCVGVGSGTDALWVALLCLGVKPGDEVITVPNTFIATTEAISFCGAKPVLVDVDETTHTMDPTKIEAAITEKTKAIIPVHLYGQMADLDPIIAIAKKHNLAVVEDAAQAHDALYKDNPPGTLSNAACFSFYPGKNLGAYGEAGAVVTNDSELTQKMKMFRDHGQAKKYYHAMVGWNARMDGFQGGVLSVKLKYLSDYTNARRKNAEIYNEQLRGVDGIVLPKEADYAKHVYHIYATRVKNRDAFMKAMADEGVGTAIHYPVSIHLQEAYSDLGLSEGAFPIAETIASELVSLPMFPELEEEQTLYACEKIKAYFS